MNTRKVVIVGAGPAGLMAAGEASLAGAQTCLYEKMRQPGRKLSITGKGRCNLTNGAEPDDFVAHFGRTGSFLRQAFARYFNHDLMDFFEGRGVKLVVERGGRVFPETARAPDVTAALVAWARDCGAALRTGSPASGLLVESGTVTGITCGRERIASDAVILATGGKSYPGTGSTGDGYRLASSVGHTVKPCSPCLVPLQTAGRTARRLAGLDLRNVGVTLCVGERARYEGFGELSFTASGITGPTVLSLSGNAVEALSRQARVAVVIDLKPALDAEKLDRRLQRDLSKRGGEAMTTLLGGLLPRPLIPLCLEQTGLTDGYRRGSSITAAERRHLGSWLKGFHLEVTAHRGFGEALVTAGGIDTREVDPRTMQSRLAPGLFFAGELLDVQADTGGYNLQAAFSTGWLAGRAAAVAVPGLGEDTQPGGGPRQRMKG